MVPLKVPVPADKVDMVPNPVMLGWDAVIRVPVRFAAVTIPLKLALVPTNVDAIIPDDVTMPVALKVAADTMPDKVAVVPI